MSRPAIVNLDSVGYSGWAAPIWRLGTRDCNGRDAQLAPRLVVTSGVGPRSMRFAFVGGRKTVYPLEVLWPKVRVEVEGGEELLAKAGDRFFI